MEILFSYVYKSVTWKLSWKELQEDITDMSWVKAGVMPVSIKV